MLLLSYKELAKKIHTANSFRDVIKISCDILVETFPESSLAIYVNLKSAHFVKYEFIKSKKDYLPEFISKEIENGFQNENNLILIWKEDKKRLTQIFGQNLPEDIANVILIPILGQSRTLGVILLSNIRNWPLSEKEQIYLNLLSSEISNHGSFHLRKELLECFQDIKKASKCYLGDLINKENYLKKVADSVVSKPGINYTVCIIRILSSSDDTIKSEIISHYNKLNWNNFNSSKSIKPITMKFKKLRHGNSIFTDEITNYKKFNNAQWLIDNKLRSYACVSIVIDNEHYGFLSIFIPYKYHYYEYDHKFLSLIAADIAHTLFAHDIKEKLREERNKGMEIASLSSTQYQNITEKLHSIKNDIARSIKVLGDYSRHNDLRNIRSKLDRQKHELEILLSQSSEPSSDENSYFNFNEVIHEVIKEIRNIANDEGIDISLNLEATDDLVHASESAIKGAVRNLVDNALKACALSKDDKKEIQLTTFIETDRANLNWIVLIIYDNGVGVRNEIMSQIFNEGFSGFSSESTGKGLYLARSAILNAAGEIDLASSVGRHTTFQIKLPLEED